MLIVPRCRQYVRVQHLDRDDFKKIVRVMKYLQGTVGLPFTLSSDGSGTLAWWVDASYAGHPEMKGHTGGMFSMGQGIVYSTSTRQKLETRSSTERELVGIRLVFFGRNNSWRLKVSPLLSP
jgi:hypothetical protein